MPRSRSQVVRPPINMSAGNTAAWHTAPSRAAPRRAETRRGETRRGEVRRGEVRRGETRRGEARRGEARQAGAGEYRAARPRREGRTAYRIACTTPHLSQFLFATSCLLCSLSFSLFLSFSPSLFPAHFFPPLLSHFLFHSFSLSPSSSLSSCLPLVSLFLSLSLSVSPFSPSVYRPPRINGSLFSR